MAAFIIMPKLGMTMTAGTITKWLKKEGDAVKKGDPVFELESDKLSNTQEAPADGILRKILVPEGQEVSILEHVGIVAETGEDISALTGGTSAEAPAEVPAPQPAPAQDRKPTDGRIVATPRAKKVARELGVDLALVTPTGPKGSITEKDVWNYQAAPAPAEAAAVSVSPAAPAVKASPLAAKAAAALGVDLAELKKDGRILAADLLAYLEKERTAAPTADCAVQEERKPMSGMRKAIAQNMQASHMTSPTVTYNTEVDMSAMRTYREQLKSGGVKVSYTDLLVKFVSRALKEFPLLNCSIEDGEIIYKHYINMGVAVALDNGLVVPNIRNADQKSLTEISAEVKSLAEAARNGSLSMDQMRGGTFTITNLGMYGIRTFSPIINQPEVAILGVNAMVDTMVVRNGEAVIRPMMNLSLTADHRAVDGAVAAQFLQRVRELLENPALMLA